MKCGKCKHEILYTRVNFYTNRTKGPCHKVCPKRRGHKVHHFVPVRIDREATAARKFLDPRSRVMPDGREILYGEDWKIRKAELRVRSCGRCERVKLSPHLGAYRCLNDADDAHHVVKRSKLRDDRLQALGDWCRGCHNEAHPEKRLRNPKVSAANG